MNIEVLDEHQNGGSGEGSSDADMVQFSVVAEGEFAVVVDGDHFRLFISPHIIRNLTRILGELKLGGSLIEGYLAAALELVEASGGQIIEPARKCFDVEDYEDNLIVDISLACDATLIVSDDTDLTDLSPWHSRMPILRPHVFVERMVQSRRTRRR